MYHMYRVFCVTYLILLAQLVVSVPMARAIVVVLHDSYYRTHEPGTPSADISFPLVYYLAGHAERFMYDPAFEAYPEESITLPEYLGYLVIDKDFRLTFVNKTQHPVRLSTETDYLNAMPQDGRYIIGNFPGSAHTVSYESPHFWIPRWSWNFVLEFAYHLAASYHDRHATLGVPPDDDFVPIFEETRQFSLRELREYKNKELMRINNGNSSADETYPVQFTILNSPFGGKVPFCE